MDDPAVTDTLVGPNKVVSLTYVLRNERGEVFELRDVPMVYVHGADGTLFPAVAAALEGRAAGERIAVTLTPAQAFGEPDPRLRVTDDPGNVPAELARLGQQFEAQNARGEKLTFVVTDIADGKLTVDANHPLAGQRVTFEVTLQHIRDARPEEIRAGRPLAPGTAGMAIR
jgi:FKBP-type peptidyl-prolyl cis-trans isomerase SlyD